MNNHSKGGSHLQPATTMQVDRLEVQVYASRHDMGVAAAKAAAEHMRKLLEQQHQVRIVFASAPSQHEFFQALKQAEGIDWGRVIAFHMDEYVGLPSDSPQSFGRFLQHHLWDDVRPGIVHLIDGMNDAEEECERYGHLIQEAPIDMICLGVGENGHIAFNDPPVADFHDPYVMKKVKLDPISRQQQVNDGCFASIDEVPHYALTLTIPAMMSGVRLFCIVPGKSKQAAIRHMLTAEVSTSCPATILRQHDNCTLYVDLDAFGAVWHED